MIVAVETVVPVFAVAFLGWWLAGRTRLDVGTLSEVAIFVASPALVFSVLAENPLELRRWGELAGGVAWIASGTALVAFLVARISGAGRGFVLCSVFWNAGNITLPCARLAFGPEGFEVAAIIFVLMASLTYGAGIWIAKGEGGLAEALRLPLLWAAAAGLATAASGLTLPRVVLEPVHMLGAMAVPLMLLNLGAQLRGLRVSDVRHSVAAVAIRMGGGAACGLLFVTLFGVSGVERQVLLLASVMPAAVINVVFAQRYDAEPSLVASAIVLGTLASLVAIPAVLWFAA